METVGPLTLGTAASEHLIGGATDDLIFGAGGNDTLQGGAGDDMLIAGVGSSTLTGGAGHDIFKLSPGAQVSQITDFAQGQDRIDLSDWGRLYDMSALTISTRSDGALISFGDMTLRVSQAGGGTIPISAWGADDFIF
ncbi:MAG: hypothetical protein JXR75_07735 [Rhodobacteraceae bacterium]|nr:hypothetical protein [Paracoccaceae bacterium]